MNNILKERIVNTIIFFCCFTVSLIVAVLLGLNKVGFGNLIVYAIVFCILECLQLFLMNVKIQLLLFPINIYLSYCLTGFCLIVIPKRDIYWKNLFCPSIGECEILLCLSTILSITGYVVLFDKKPQEKQI